MNLKKILNLLSLLLLLLCTQANIALAAPTILYIPQDDRPVCLDDMSKTGQAVGLDIKVPPKDLLASRSKSANIESLWRWLNGNVITADAVIVSADSLLYGGLVPSRKHNLKDGILEERRSRLERLKEINPDLKVYVFSTILRSPKATAGGVDIKYYEEYGKEIFELGALLDKREQGKLVGKEKYEIIGLEHLIPEEYLKDWRKRRMKSIQNNLALLKMTETGEIDYFLLGKDDYAEYSDSQRDTRWLVANAKDMINPAKFMTTSGADQLSMILLTRSYNEFYHIKPKVKVIYTDGLGGKVIPTYQGITAEQNVGEQLLAAGAIQTQNEIEADLVLAVHTAFDGITREAGDKANVLMTNKETKLFARNISNLIKQGYRVAIADISYGNGADNSFMFELKTQNIWTNLNAYAGWNTASNSVGFAIGQGLLALNMSKDAKNTLLITRLLDDWGYQANVRGEVADDVIGPRDISWVQLDSNHRKVEFETQWRLRQFADINLKGLEVPFFNVYHPWNRMFEIGLEFQEKENAYNTISKCKAKI